MPPFWIEFHVSTRPQLRERHVVHQDFRLDARLEETTRVDPMREESEDDGVFCGQGDGARGAFLERTGQGGGEVAGVEAEEASKDVEDLGFGADVDRDEDVDGFAVKALGGREGRWRGWVY